MFARLRQILFIICIFSVVFVHAQKRAVNDWIDPAKTYYKIKTAKDGIYRVTYEDLKAVGFSSANVPASELKLINFGAEQPIYVSNDVFGPGAYIEFFGQRNTIGLDTFLYKNWRADLFNTEYSLVNDTNAYFLTLSPETQNLRYQTVDPDYSNNTLVPEKYYLHTEKVIYSTNFYKNVDGEIRYSQFEPSEGFGSGMLQNSETILKISRLYKDGPPSLLQFRTGQNNHQAKLEVKFNGPILETRIIDRIKTAAFSYQIDNNQLKDNNSLNLKNINSSSDRHSIAWASLTYPREFDAGNNETFAFAMTPFSGPRLIEIENMSSSASGTVVYHISGNKRYNTLTVDNKVKVIIDNTEAKDLFLAIQPGAGVISSSSISVFKPTDFSYNGQQYLIITDKSLRGPGMDAVQEYASYRAGAQGGGYKTDIIEVDAIYNHYGFGIDRHFMSVKFLAAYLKENWPGLEFVMMLGKAIEYPFVRTSEQVAQYNHKLFFVPTFGFSGSDNLLFSEGGFPDPFFAVGRLAAKTPEDILNYLSKVQLYEAAPLGNQTLQDKYWMKKILHLGGGKNEFEQSSIKTGLNRMAQLLQDTIYGGDVRSYFKSSSEPIQFNVNEDINRLFESGLSIINFFGHSAPGTWDFAIENPRNYNNFGKYPFINSFGCYSGNLHGTVKGISESFVLEKDRGSIAFFASTGTAFIPSLSNYGFNMYSSALNADRNKTIGQVITMLAQKNRNSLFAELALFTQLTYHGDPALRLYLNDSPDYVFDDASAKTLPSVIQASSPAYEIQLDVVNIGAYRKDSVSVVFYHALPSGKVIDTIRMTIAGVANRVRLSVPLKNYGNISVGRNTLYSSINPDMRVTEAPLPAALSNNSLGNGNGFTFFITDNFATAIYPPRYGIINTPEHFVLSASTSSAPVQESSYIFEVDTTSYFNSAQLETGKVLSSGGLIRFRPQKPLLQGKVYYWRVSPDSTSQEGYKWTESSFIYLPNEAEGWNQSHFFQFTDNTFKDLEISEETGRRFDFGDQLSVAKVRNRLWDIDDKPGYTFDNVRFGSVTPWDYMDAGLGFVINDRNEFIAGIFNPPGGKYGSINPLSTNSRGFFFKTDTPQARRNIITFLESELKDRYYINAFTILKTAAADLHLDEWAMDSVGTGKNLFNVLESLGATQIRNLLSTGPVPYIFQGEKGRGAINEKIANSVDDIIEAELIVSRNLDRGQVSSVLIGPATSWASLDFKFNEFQGPGKAARLRIAGVREDGSEQKIDSLQGQGKLDISAMAGGFPYLKLTALTKDSLQRISPQLQYWRVSHKSLPDAAVVFKGIEPSATDNTVSQGQKIRVRYEVQNVNFVDMDSIEVRLTYLDAGNVPVVRNEKLAKIPAGGSIAGVFEFSLSVGSGDETRYTIEINPENKIPELYSFNNIISGQLGVKKDRKNPLLNVYFDGMQIMDGDIVSPKPEILILLDDDNPFLPVADPGLFEIKLDTGRNEFKVISPDDAGVSFIPADGSGGAARFQFAPALKEGTYRILAQAKDVSGNKSGQNPKSIQFRVVEKESVSNVLNYPNPFSTSTQFIFTITGSEVPEVMTITIMTLTGQVVREITMDELGPLNIGLNRTRFKWDGTDEFGNRLANGVYLYRVNVRRRNGQLYDHFGQAKTDGFFRDGIGKMVIMR